MEVKMRTETVIKMEAMNLLLKTFGVLETERFIASIKNSSFDYTEWQKNLWNDKSIDEVHQIAVEFEKNQQPRSKLLG
jgi:hypothetical protein